jgi:hypothetical protein
MYIWKGTITYPNPKEELAPGDPETITEPVMLATETKDITETTNFYFINENTTMIDKCGGSEPIWLASGFTVTEEDFSQVDYNHSFVVTVKYIHTEQTGDTADDFDIITDKVVEYYEPEVPFYDLVEDISLASYGKYGRGACLSYYENGLTKENIYYADLGACGTVTTNSSAPEEFAALLKQKLMNGTDFSSLYDFSTEKFTSVASGKTIYVMPRAEAS